jgi:FkbM family methyltransferase
VGDRLDLKRRGDVSRLGEYSFISRCIAALPSGTPAVVVDVGAFGKEASNSWNFIVDDGWRGLLLEPHPKRAARCREEFVGDVVVEAVAAAASTGTATLYNFAVPGWASLREDWGRRQTHKPAHLREQRRSFTVPTVRLPDMLAKHTIPERFGVLSIDAEGTDQTIMGTVIDSPWRPDFIIIEDCPHDMLVTAGYDLLWYRRQQQIWIQRQLSGFVRHQQ